MFAAALVRRDFGGVGHSLVLMQLPSGSLGVSEYLLHHTFLAVSSLAPEHFDILSHPYHRANKIILKLNTAIRKIEKRKRKKCVMVQFSHT